MRCERAGIKKCSARKQMRLCTRSAAEEYREVWLICTTASSSRAVGEAGIKVVGIAEADRLPILPPTNGPFPFAARLRIGQDGTPEVADAHVQAVNIEHLCSDPEYSNTTTTATRRLCIRCAPLSLYFFDARILICSPGLGTFTALWPDSTRLTPLS